MASSEVDRILQDIRKISRSNFKDDEAGRYKMLSEAQKLCQRLETPKESILRMTFQEPSLNCALRIADKLDVFRNLGPAGSPPKTITELATPLNADPELVKRVLRHCAAKNVLLEGGNDTYQATELTEALSTVQGSAPIRCVASKFNPVFQHVPEYLESTGFQVPRNNRDGPFQHSSLGKVGQTHFEWMEQPEAKHVADDFNLLMRWGAAGDRSWVEAFPTEALVQDLDPKQALMVDIGGNLGHNAIAFKKQHYNVPGQVIVQDLPHVIKQATKEGTGSELQFQEHDFFKPQPIRGAKIYFMGHVLHDWPDEEAHKILANIVGAMKTDYSQLILREKVLPNTGCNPQLSSIDLIMMAELASHERTDEQWASLLSQHSLSLVRVCPIAGTEDSVLHAILDSIADKN